MPIVDFKGQFNLTMEDGKSRYGNEKVIESCCRRGSLQRANKIRKQGAVDEIRTLLCQTVSPVSHKARHVILHWKDVHPVL